MDRPKISVIMPIYNGEKNFLRESVKSILNQSFKNFEFIMIDDGSSDSTWDILCEYAKRDDRIKLFRNLKNEGIVGSLNKGLNLASANIVGRMDCGDICLENRLNEQYNFLMKNEEFILVGSQFYYINPKGEIISKSSFPCNDYNIRKELFLKNNVILHPTAMFRWNGNLCYREFAYPTEDYDLWLRLSHIGRIAILNKHLMKIRLNPEGISFSNRLKQIKTVDYIHQLLIERLQFGKELSKELSTPCMNKDRRGRFFEDLFQKVVRSVITSKKELLPWLFFVSLAHILYPKMIHDKISQYFKRFLLRKSCLFKKFLDITPMHSFMKFDSHIASEFSIGSSRAKEYKSDDPLS